LQRYHASGVPDTSISDSSRFRFPAKGVKRGVKNGVELRGLAGPAGEAGRWPVDVVGD
jgi:hypothetical protein